MRQACNRMCVFVSGVICGSLAIHHDSMSIEWVRNNKLQLSIDTNVIYMVIWPSHLIENGQPTRTLEFVAPQSDYL